MTKQKSLSIIAFVGLPGSGKTTAAAHLATLGAPHITSGDTEEIIQEITHIADAGQRLIALDDLASWEQCLAIKHAFPGTLSVVALTAKPAIRYHRLSNRDFDTLSLHDAQERDYAILHASEKAEPIAAADYTIVNEGHLASLVAELDAIVAEIRSCSSDLHC